MKIILQDYEPQARPFAADGIHQPVQYQQTVRKSRLRLVPAKADFRLFHAL